VTDSAGRALKISVIVTVFNTGERLREIVNSLDAQSLPADEFEVLLVDDGSTDDTLALARELAASRPNVVVETIPNSGWPGRPRNVGIDLARGEYVFFADHDDRFGPRALERLYDSARANRSDIVYGKIVRVGRSTPYWSLWARDIGAVDIAEVAVISRTVHKLYRRQFLLEHELRFAEGKVRVEDHLFMAAALPKAGVVSILASEPCYWWIHRKSDAHISEAAVDPSVYWHDYTQVLATFERSSGPGALLDAARVVVAAQAFARFTPKAYLARTPQSERCSMPSIPSSATMYRLSSIPDSRSTNGCASRLCAPATSPVSIGCSSCAAGSAFAW
jgi:glycosyltransferase involved in cell wall biosynthesis